MSAGPLTKEICAVYFRQRDRCKGCPLMSVCHDGPTGRRATLEAIAAHVQAVEDKAHEVREGER